MEEGRGAAVYGLCVSGVSLGEAVPAQAPEGWPELRVSAEPELPRHVVPYANADGAALSLGGGSHLVVVERAAASAVFHGPRLPADELAHPFFSPAAAIVSRWLGREAFHGGAFVGDDGRAIAVLGDREAGKSTLLAALAAQRVPVLADDLIVIGDGHVFGGPRTIDLRAAPGEQLTGSGALVVAAARGGRRWRLGVPAAPPSAPIGGWVFLSSAARESSSPQLDRLPATVRLERIARARGYPGLASDPRGVLELAAAPAWDLRVPRTWTALDEVVQLLRALRT